MYVRQDSSINEAETRSLQETHWPASQLLLTKSKTKQEKIQNKQKNGIISKKVEGQVRHLSSNCHRSPEVYSLTFSYTQTHIIYISILYTQISKMKL